MAANIIKGDDLMLFDSTGKSIAYATSHTLTISGDAVDVSTKDHGIWGASEVNKINWEITSDNLYSDTAFDNLFTLMMARTAITVYFGKHTAVSGNPVDGPITEWTGLNGSTFTGKAFITNLSVNANTGENATFSITLTGAGSLSKTTAGQGVQGTQN